MKICKRTIALVTAALVAITVLSSCKKDKTDVENGGSYEKKHSVVCSAFPQYDWVRVLLGDRLSEYDIILLSGKGADMHSYQPTAEDMKDIAAADMFIYGRNPSSYIKTEICRPPISKKSRHISHRSLRKSIPTEKRLTKTISKNIFCSLPHLTPNIKRQLKTANGIPLFSPTDFRFYI